MNDLFSDSGDPNEPFITEMEEPWDDPALLADSDDEDAPAFDLAWSMLRRKILPVIEQRAEAKAKAAAMAQTGSPAAECSDAGGQQAAARKQTQVTFQVSVPHARPTDAYSIRVIVSGPSPVLGSSDPLKAPELTTDPSTFPIFVLTLAVPSATRLDFQYGILRLAPDGNARAPTLCQWEGSKREMEVEGESRHLIHSFKEDRRTYPRVTEQEYQLSAQEWSRWMKHHMKVSQK
eukprot:CAMPEP_0181314880 /NCGR_PEP_ID=MMETSP1101-20121128/15061_1 /TAXON_ID=46948 /ORGANISM="Rhodomonas abbreviata, Strain Caron Lab Isolate" /LENGTH=233 /DNA_ID=CAMNT_0023422017 /DNA_START=287 /DNA_END=988 /DNA_ORIENTATION=+